MFIKVLYMHVITIYWQDHCPWTYLSSELGILLYLRKIETPKYWWNNNIWYEKIWIVKYDVSNSGNFYFIFCLKDKLYNCWITYLNICPWFLTNIGDLDFYLSGLTMWDKRTLDAIYVGLGAQQGQPRATSSSQSSQVSGYSMSCSSRHHHCF